MAIKTEINTSEKPTKPEFPRLMRGKRSKALYLITENYPERAVGIVLDAGDTKRQFGIIVQCLDLDRLEDYTGAITISNA